MSGKSIDPDKTARLRRPVCPCCQDQHGILFSDAKKKKKKKKNVNFTRFVSLLSFASSFMIKLGYKARETIYYYI